MIGSILALADFPEQHVELMPRELRVEVLEFDLNLFVAPRLAGLPLQRTDLALHFLDEVLQRATGFARSFRVCGGIPSSAT
ncbi:MAG: hypothetical protein QM813_02575 [Verrucomicrobiota bacterium]